MRRGWLSLSALCAVSCAALPACDDATPVQRGFGSRQILALRDSTFSVFYANGDLVYYETGYQNGLPPDRNPAPTYWSIDVTTGEVTNLGMTTPDIATLIGPSTGSPARYKCSYEIEADGTTSVFTITDTRTGVMTAIQNAAWTSPFCPADDDPTLQCWRVESDRTYSFWQGPFSELQQAPLSVVVHQVLWRETDRTLVAATSAAAPDGLGVYLIPDADPSIATEIVPAALGPAAWAAGAVPSGPLASSGLAPTNLFWPATFGQTYSYERAMSDGSRVMFAGPYASETAREQALFPVVPNSGLDLLRIEPYNFRYDGHWPLTTAWNSIESASQPFYTFRIWRDASKQLAACGWQGQRQPVARADPAGENALFVNKQDCCSLLPNSALLVMVPNPDDGNPCRVLATDDVSTADFSPDGTAMFWLVEPPGAKPALWTAARDGSAPRKIGEAAIAGVFDLRSGAPHFIADSQLELALDEDLVWLDVHDDPVRMHYITERTFGYALDLGRWVVTGHDYSHQDTNGSLALVNRDDGTTREISPGVTSYMSPDLPLYGGGTPGVLHDDGAPVRVLYMVRGRNPSAQDGLWLATITAQDRQ